MSSWQLIVAEIAHRWGSFALAVAATAMATILFIAAPTLLESYRDDTHERLAAQDAAATRELDGMQAAAAAELDAVRAETAQQLADMETRAAADLVSMEKETIQIMRDLGFNLRIFHRSTNPSKLLAGFEAFDMPEEYVARLAGAPQLTKVAHLVATLRKMVEIDGEPRLVIGYAPETPQPHVEKKERVMGYQIKPGQVFLGKLAAQRADGGAYAVGERIEVLGRTFTVAQVLDEHGTREEDLAILMSLADAQQVLDKPGKISEIVALGCKCKTIQRVEEIRDQLEAVLPEAQVVELKIAADARDRQRKLVADHHRRAIAEHAADREKLLAEQQSRHTTLVAHQQEKQTALRDGMAASRISIERMLAGLTDAVAPVVILACAVWVGLLAWNNVRERVTEIGLLRALGRDGWSIASLLLGRALLVGLAGAAVGSVLGMVIAAWLAQSLLEIPFDRLALDPLLIGLALAGAPLVSMLAAWLPSFAALQQDPAIVLQE